MSKNGHKMSIMSFHGHNFTCVALFDKDLYSDVQLRNHKILFIVTQPLDHWDPDPHIFPHNFF